MLRAAFCEAEGWAAVNGDAELPSGTILQRPWAGHVCAIVRGYSAVETAGVTVAVAVYWAWCDGMSGRDHASIEAAIEELSWRLIPADEEWILDVADIDPPAYVPNPLPPPEYTGAAHRKQPPEVQCPKCRHSAWLGDMCVYCMASRFADIGERYGRPMRVELPDPTDSARRAAENQRRRRKTAASGDPPALIISR